jgi:hypothetical protein
VTTLEFEDDRYARTVYREIGTASAPSPDSSTSG